MQFKIKDSVLKIYLNFCLGCISPNLGSERYFLVPFLGFLAEVFFVLMVLTAIFFVRADFKREALFLWIIPFLVARSINDWASETLFEVGLVRASFKAALNFFCVTRLNLARRRSCFKLFSADLVTGIFFLAAPEL